MSSIRRARENDIPRLDDLLLQVLTVHHDIRPDLFKGGCRKYNELELAALIGNDLRPIFVYADDEDVVQGYAFCVIEQHPGNNILTDIKTLYLDDLCVDSACRGQGIGRRLYDHVKAYAKEIGCHNLTLNVWEGNDSAKRFYESLGLHPYKYGMETIL
ncbi:MAG: GNAT family N-acetyltransferase [Clostridiales bacterium]|nr:GNAT family N-acetyltransferase [Clostridiales bacterium]